MLGQPYLGEWCEKVWGNHRFCCFCANVLHETMKHRCQVVISSPVWTMLKRLTQSKVVRFLFFLLTRALIFCLKRQMLEAFFYFVLSVACSLWGSLMMRSLRGLRETWRQRQPLNQTNREQELSRDWGFNLNAVKCPDCKKNDKPWKRRQSVSKHNTREETALLIVICSRAVQWHFFCTFSLVVGEDRLVFLHDVGEEESSARLIVWLHAAAQVSPEGGFEGEVPRSRDAVLSCRVKKNQIFVIKAKAGNLFCVNSLFI